MCSITISLPSENQRIQYEEVFVISFSLSHTIHVFVWIYPFFLINLDFFLSCFMCHICRWWQWFICWIFSTRDLMHCYIANCFSRINLVVQCNIDCIINRLIATSYLKVSLNNQTPLYFMSICYNLSNLQQYLIRNTWFLPDFLWNTDWKTCWIKSSGSFKLIYRCSVFHRPWQTISRDYHRRSW